MLDATVAREMDTVPPLEHYATVDELNDQLFRLAGDHPGVATARRIGTSRLDEPLTALTVGSGEADALVFAMPHPNEPVGALTSLHLARRLCEDSVLRDRLGLRWTVVPCIDPDGTRLNEGWFRGPFTPTHYGRNFYRPAGDEQVEWTFPISYRGVHFDRPMPETLALVRLIDELRPVLMCSLHNSENGGAYYYLSRGTPALFGQLQQIPPRRGVVLDTGEPESPDLVRLDTAVFGSLSARTIIDTALADGQGVASLGGAGGSSADYADRYRTLTLLSEVPYWTSPGADDTTATGTTYADVLRANADGVGELGEVLTGVLDELGDDFRTESPFLRATRFFAPGMSGAARRSAERAELAASDRPATVAERESCANEVHSFRLRYAGILLRALEAEIGAGHATPRMRARHGALERRYAEWCAEAEKALSAEPIAIADLVAIQYGAILATADAARG